LPAAGRKKKNVYVVLGLGLEEFRRGSTLRSADECKKKKDEVLPVSFS
jgi:hypothetical protein